VIATSSNLLVQGFAGAMNNIPIPSMDEQVQSHITHSSRSSDYDTTLFVILTGGNDVFFNPDISGIRSAAAVSSAVTQLQHAGARHFLLPSYPDLMLIPYAAFIDDMAMKDKLKAWGSTHAAAIRTLCATIPHCLSLDLAKLFRRFYYYGEPAAYGFEPFGAYGSCLVGAYGETPDVTLCPEPGKRVFW